MTKNYAGINFASAACGSISSVPRFSAMKTTLYAAALIAATTIAWESPAAYPEPVRYETRVEVRPETRIVFTPSLSTRTTTTGTMVVPARAEIVVTTARKLDRPTEMVGVIDEHEPSGRRLRADS